MSSTKNITYSEELRQAAESGDLDAQCNLGLCYSGGLGVARNPHQAIIWYEKAAAKGHSPSLHDLGFHYFTGDGVPQSFEKALMLWRQAADQGYSYSINNIGSCYENGQGVPQDYAEALSWYRKAAELDLPDAMFEVGRYHYEGLGVKQNLEEAYYWLYTAFVLGDADSEELAREIRRKLGKEITSRIKGEAWPRIERIFNKTKKALPHDDEDDEEEDATPLQNHNTSSTADPFSFEVMFTGGNGSSFKNAIKIIPPIPGSGVTCEYTYLNVLAQQKGISWELDQQRLVHKDGVPYDILSVNWSDGRKEDVYFDISAFYGK